MNDEQIRKDFEEWMGDGGLSPCAIERNSKGDYILMQAAHAWEVWKAAHTHYAKSAAPVVLPTHPDTARLQQAVWRLEDILKDDDPQAWKEARKFLERLKKEQWQEAQPQADTWDEESEKLLRALYDRGYEDRAKERDYDPLGASEFDAAMCAGAARAKQALLTVRLTSFPESTGKRNWTAQFVRVKPWKGLVGSAGGITIAHGEFWNRVAYEAERARFLIGERDTEPHIRDYGTDVQTPDEWLGEQIERAVVAAAKENK